MHTQFFSSISDSYYFSQICARFDLDEVRVLDNVLSVRAYTSEHQMELLGKLK